MKSEGIKAHNFDLAKSKIKALCDNVPAEVALSTFKTKEKFIFPINHSVTGEEMNNFVKELQGSFIESNKRQIHTYKALSEIYKALEFLDKEYIQGILSAIKSAEIASNQAVIASTKAQTASAQAFDASSKALIAQADIKRTIEALQITVKALKDFKAKVSDDLMILKDALTQITSIKSRIENIEFDNQRILISDNNIRSLLESYTHLNDINTIWDDVEINKKYLLSLHQQLDSFTAETHKVMRELSVSIHEIQEVDKSNKLIYNRKIQILYVIVGGSLTLTIVQLILQILGLL